MAFVFVDVVALIFLGFTVWLGWPMFKELIEVRNLLLKKKK